MAAGFLREETAQGNQGDDNPDRIEQAKIEIAEGRGEPDRQSQAKRATGNPSVEGRGAEFEPEGEADAGQQEDKGGAQEITEIRAHALTAPGSGFPARGEPTFWGQR